MSEQEPEVLSLKSHHPWKSLQFRKENDKYIIHKYKVQSAKFTWKGQGQHLGEAAWVKVWQTGKEQQIVELLEVELRGIVSDKAVTFHDFRT